MLLSVPLRFDVVDIIIVVVAVLLCYVVDVSVAVVIVMVLVVLAVASVRVSRWLLDLVLMICCKVFDAQISRRQQATAQ